MYNLFLQYDQPDTLPVLFYQNNIKIDLSGQLIYQVSLGQYDFYQTPLYYFEQFPQSVITSTPPTNVVVDNSYNYVFEATNSNNISFQLSVNPPADWLSIQNNNGSNTGIDNSGGILSGIPTQIGQYEITITPISNNVSGVPHVFTLNVLPRKPYITNIPGIQ